MSLMLLIFVLIIVTIFISIILINMKWFNLFKLYLTLVSLWSLAWFIVAFWIGSYQFAMKTFISDDEYLVGSYNNYEIKNCENTDYYYDKAISTTEWKPVKKSEEEINKCKEKAKTEIITKRNYNHKETIIWWITFSVIFFIVFIIHFPVFLKKNKEEINA